MGGLRVTMWITQVAGKFRHGLLEKSLVLARAEGNELNQSQDSEFCGTS